MRLHALPLALLALVACKAKGTGPSDPGTISLAVSPGNATVNQGDNTPVSATLTRGGGFQGDVTLTVEGVPTGVTGSVGNVVTTGGITSATVTITVAMATAPGTYNLTVRGAGSGVTPATAAFALTVLPAPDFSISSASGSASITQGQSGAPIALILARSNFSGAVTFFLTGPVPAGVTAAFTPPSTTDNTGSVTISVGAATAPGVYNLNLTGTGAPGAHNTPFVLTVVAAGSFTLAVAPAGGVNIVQGTPDNSRTVTIARVNYGGTVTLTTENLPSGLTAELAPNPTGGNNSVLTLTASGAVAPNTYTITIRGTGPASLLAHGAPSNVEATTTLAVTVTAPGGSFTLAHALPCNNLSLQQNGLDDSRVVVITRNNFPFAIALSVEGLPAGVTGTFAPNPASGNSARLRLSAGAAVAPGSYPLTIRGLGPAGLRTPGSSADLESTAALTLNVTAGSAPTPSVLSYDFATGLQGWAPGVSCPFQSASDWGNVVAQEQMFVLDGVGPAGNVGVPNAWVSKVIAIPATAWTFLFDASGHNVNGAGSRVGVRVLDGAVSTTVFDQAITGSAPVRVFHTYAADISAFAGKTVRIFVEQDDNGFNSTFPGAAEQAWLDNFRVVGSTDAQLDAMCPGPRTSQTGGGTTKRFAQVFTAQHAGLLVHATMEISGNPAGGDFIMAIRGADGSGKPVGPPLATTTIPNVTPTNLAQNRTLDANFLSPATVTAGQRYAVSVEPAAGQVFYVNGRTGTAGCAGSGSRWADPASSEAWSLDSIDPLLFTIYVAVP